MRKTTANPFRLLHRAQRHVAGLQQQLASLHGILFTLEAAINQGDVMPGDAAQDVDGRLRWIEYELHDEVWVPLQAVRTQTSELLKRLEPELAATAHQAEGHAIALQIPITPFPESFQQDMDQTFQQAAATLHSAQPVHPQVFPPPQVPPGDQPTPSPC